jgi:hypothetical protein
MQKGLVIQCDICISSMDKLLYRKECTHVKYEDGTGSSFSDTKEIRFAIGAAVALLWNRGTHLLPTCTLLNAVWKVCNLWFVAAIILCLWYVMHHGCLFSSTFLLFPGTGYFVAWFCLMAVLRLGFCAGLLGLSPRPVSLMTML